MNKSLALAILLTLGFAAGARAEYFGDVYVDPLGAIGPFDGVGVGFEFAIPRNASFRIQGRLNGRGDYPAPARSRSVQSLEAGLRFFFSDTRQMQGFFLGPLVGLGVQNDVYTDRNGNSEVTASGNYYKAGIEFGHQWILGPGFVLTPGITASFIPGFAVGSDRPSQEGRIYGGLELNLGWAFSR